MYSWPISVPTPMGDSIITRRFYMGFMVSIHCRETFIDLIELDISEFDVILGMAFKIGSDVILRYQGRLCFPNVDG